MYDRERGDTAGGSAALWRLFTTPSIFNRVFGGQVAYTIGGVETHLADVQYLGGSLPHKVNQKCKPRLFLHHRGRGDATRERAALRRLTQISTKQTNS